MALVTINDKHLTDIANALRTHYGETKIIRQEEVRESPMVVSKTPNATGFGAHSGGYGNNTAFYDVVKIPGASTIKVKMAYCTESASYDYVKVASGELTSMPSSAVAYGGKTLKEVELEFSNTDVITFYFRSDSSNDNYLGYYAECRGYDADGNPAKTTIVISEEEVPNTYKVSDFSTAIANISSGGGIGDIKYTQVVLTNMSSGVIGPFSIYDYVDDFDKILGLVVRVSTDSNGKNNTQTYLKGMKTWDNQPATGFSGNKVKAIQTDNSMTATADLNETAAIISGWYGLALLDNGQLAWAYYNDSSNYQCITYPNGTSSWTSAYARIELIYI